MLCASSARRWRLSSAAASSSDGEDAGMNLYFAALPLWGRPPAHGAARRRHAFALIGSWGPRLSDFYKRLHGRPRPSRWALGCILLASALWFALRGSYSLHEPLIALFLMITAPVAAQMMVRPRSRRSVGASAEAAAAAGGRCVGGIAASRPRSEPATEWITPAGADPLRHGHQAAGERGTSAAATQQHREEPLAALCRAAPRRGKGISPDARHGRKRLHDHAPRPGNDEAVAGLETTSRRSWSCVTQSAPPGHDAHAGCLREAHHLAPLCSPPTGTVGSSRRLPPRCFPCRRPAPAR